MKKSEYTKSLILKAACEEFREVGYTSATINGITSRIHVNPSLLSYHFKNLYSITRIILDNLSQKIEKKISTLTFEEPLSAFFAANLLEELVTFNNKENLRFRVEIAYSKSVSKYTSYLSHNATDKTDHKYLELLNHYGYTLPYDLFQKIRTIESSGKREMWIQCYEKNLIETYSENEWWKLTCEITYTTVSLIFRFANFPVELIDKCFEEAKLQLKNINLSDLTLLDYATE